MKHRLQDAFNKIHAEQELKISTMEFLENTPRGYRKRNVSFSRRLIAAVVCFALLFSAGTGCSAYLTPAFAISIDINPSIELGINRFNKVVSVDTFNEEGDFIMSDVNVYYLNYEDALERILDDKDMKKYITQNQLIAVTVFGKNEENNNELLDHVTACTSSYKNVHCSSGNSGEVMAAHEAGMSFGKYKAFLELQALNPDITAEDIKDLTMRQIRDMIAELSGNTDEANSDGTGENSGSDKCKRGHFGHGSGYGNGQGNGLCPQKNSGD